LKLCDLLGGEVAIEPADAALEVGGLAFDSRMVRPGDVFFALTGSREDGARFTTAAIAAGAVAVVGDHGGPGCSVPFIRIENPRRILALAAARLFPAQPATTVAVTGTSGKTSVAAFTRQIWQHLGFAAASIGTTGLVAPGRSVYGSLTTPDPVLLHRQVDAITREGVTHLAFEASSHGLDQHRLDGMRISAGGFTNLSRDHMDYHSTMAHYLRAKLRLFGELIPPGGTAVVAADHECSGEVMAAARGHGLAVMAVGEKGDGDRGIRLIRAEVGGFSQALEVEHAGRRFAVRLPLPGGFQIENALVAAGLAIATGSEPGAVFAAFAQLEGAKGRLERVAAHNGALIFIDYAHKPDALAKALQALRPYAGGRLVVVFGAGGDRDAGKRPIMGKIAVENADLVIITDDNPRGERPEVIRSAIVSGAWGAAEGRSDARATGVAISTTTGAAEARSGAGAQSRADLSETQASPVGVREIGDRAQAIEAAVAGLGPGDVLLIAGKGHETGQIIGNQILPFSDHAAVAAALKGAGAS